MAALGGLVAAPAATAAQQEQRAASAPPSWHGCAPPPEGVPDGGQRCATLAVPLDYAHPKKGTISVAISRIASARPSLRRGVLLLNPGGPGGSGLDMPRLLSTVLPQEVKDRYDLIGFDPRGVGASSPVTCGLSADEAGRALVPLTQAHSFDATAAFARSVADRCAKSGGAELPYVNTPNTARDMDRVRQALGETKISYLGYSYGTYLGAAYSSMYPQRTDRIVLDSSVNPDGVWRDVFRAWGESGQIRFPDFLRFAADHDAAYHLGATPEGVQATYYRLLAALRAHPLQVPGGPLVDDAYFREITFSVLYDDAAFDAGAQIWGMVQEGTTSASRLGAALRSLPVAGPSNVSAAVPVDNGTAAGLAVLCNDVKWSRSVATYRHQLATDRALYPAFGELGSNIFACAFWHTSPVEKPVAISSHGPTNVLMVQNLRDPATGYFGALKMRAALGGRSRLVTVDQGGHAVAYLKPNQCANGRTTAFLVFGSLPGADAYCGAEAPSGRPGLLSAESEPSSPPAARDVLSRMW